MVNQYEDERSQQIYFLIDKSRSMRLPFHDMSLLDYSINTSLVMANIALKKQDKAGLITFSSTMETMIKAEKTTSQLSTFEICEKNQKTPNTNTVAYTAVKYFVICFSLAFFLSIKRI